MGWLRRRHHLDVEGTKLALLVAGSVLLFVAAGVGMSYVAGFDAVNQRLHSFTWPWAAAIVGAETIAYIGYYFGYRGIEHVEGGPDFDKPRLRAVVTAGFGGFLAHGGAALDDYAMKAGGADDREAAVRVTALGGFEHGVLAIIVSGAAIAVLIAGYAKPPPDFTLPWAIIPALGFAAGLWAAERYRERLRERDGWRGKLGIFFDGCHLVRELFRYPGRNRWAVFGMGIYWLADMFALWAGMAAFGFHMNGAALIVAYGTGMLLTRRTAPLGGAGLLLVTLAPTIWYSGAPWSAAVLGTATYRFISLFGPMPLSFAALPRLRELAHGAGTPGHGTREREGEPALGGG